MIFQINDTISSVHLSITTSTTVNTKPGMAKSNKRTNVYWSVASVLECTVRIIGGHVAGFSGPWVLIRSKLLLLGGGTSGHQCTKQKFLISYLFAVKVKTKKVLKTFL